MTMISSRAVLMVAAAIGGLTMQARPSEAQIQAQANCDWYARTALKQQQENEQNKCGFTGANWSSDLKAHLQWCNTNPNQFRTEAQRRDQQLSTCKK